MNSSRTALLAAFKEAAFDPRKPGTLSTIVSSNKVDYLTERAMEIIRDSNRFTGAERKARIRDAVAVLGYAMTLVETPSGS